MKLVEPTLQLPTIRSIVLSMVNSSKVESMMMPFDLFFKLSILDFYHFPHQHSLLIDILDRELSNIAHRCPLYENLDSDDLTLKIVCDQSKNVIVLYNNMSTPGEFFENEQINFPSFGLKLGLCTNQILLFRQ